MSQTPLTVDDVQQLVRGTATIRLRAGGTKSAGDRATDEMDLRRLAGIVEYSPDECVFTARAGTPLTDIVSALGEHGQYLPFDPPFVEAGATIGGTVASGVSGPGRYRYGGVRDFLIGVRLVDGDGRAIRSGGKVVKNAAGFLLHHGVVGSGGRFGVITEATFKVFPAPEARRTLSIDCGSVDHAFQTARRIEQWRVDCEAIDFDERGRLTVTIAGRAAALDRRAARLTSEGLSPASGTVPFTWGLSPHRGTVPRTGGLSPPGESPQGDSASGSVVKVAGLMKSWQILRHHAIAAHFMCAGAVAWLTTDDLPALGNALAQAQLTGQVICGRQAGARVGHVIDNEFEARVRQVLDPHNRFSAAPHPGH
jgi:glycolate oxidase FAD binding subunit